MQMKVLRKLFLHLFALPKTIFFNFWYLPFGQAIRFPVIVSHRVWLMEMSGTVTLGNTRTGAVKIGFGNVSLFDQHLSRTIWKVSQGGSVDFKGKAFIGHGSKINVEGSLVLGDRFSISAESSIVANHKVVIGDRVLISWEVLIMDSDFHSIFDDAGNHINRPLPITIGNGVWLGCRSLILKGVTLADGVVVAAGSTVTKPVAASHTLVGGSPAAMLRENISWK
jgi:acetyltransferase-like isoleucine patch superfamily enzyme